MSERLHWIMGVHAVQAALKRQGAVKQILVDRNRNDRRINGVLSTAEQTGVDFLKVSSGQLDLQAEQGRHQGIMAQVRMPQTQDEPYLKALMSRLQEPAMLLLLDGVQDPHNLGACLRTADAVGVDAVIAPRDGSAGLNATVCKVASGAAETVPFIQVTNLARTMSWLKQQGVWLVGTADAAEESLYTADLKGPIGLVMGSEGKGLRRLTQQNCDKIVTIPMYGNVESLNVSVATGVALYEISRQRSG